MTGENASTTWIRTAAHWQRGFLAMNRILKIVPDKCTGCMQCELACSFVQTGTFQPSRSVIRVHVFDEEASYAPYTCLQCQEAWCMNVCPVNAIAVDQVKAYQVTYDTSKELERLVPIWIPAGRLGQGEDVARIALFLASDLSSWVTGDIVAADGGTLAAGGWYRTPTGWTNRPLLHEWIENPSLPTK